MSKAYISSLMLAKVKHPSPPDMPARVQPCSIPVGAKDTKDTLFVHSKHWKQPLVAHVGRKESSVAPPLLLAWLKLGMALGMLPLALQPGQWQPLPRWQAKVTMYCQLEHSKFIPNAQNHVQAQQNMGRQVIQT